MSFFELPYYDLGFTDTEWEEMPAAHKRVIRDFMLNGRNQTRTVIYDYYEDDSTVRKIVNRYDLTSRPLVHIGFTNINLY